MLRFTATLILVLGATPAAAQRSWVTSTVRYGHDDQPRTSLLGRLELGHRFVPAASVALTLEAERLSSSDPWPPRAALAQTVLRPGLTATFAPPRARFGVGGELARISGLPGGETAVAWKLSPSLSLGGGVVVRGTLDRDRSTATLSSLDTLVLRRGWELALDRSGAPDWAFALTWRRDDHGDDNPVTSVSAWFLAPLARSSRHSIRAGYAFGWHDAAESRWVMRPPAAAPPGGGLVEGGYDPYYTPHDQRVHSVAADAAVAVGSGWLMLNGAVAVVARELAPEYRAPTGGGGAVLLFTEREFRPWRMAATLAVPTSPVTWLRLTADHQRTAHWQTTRAAVTLTHSF